MTILTALLFALSAFAEAPSPRVALDKKMVFCKVVDDCVIVENGCGGCDYDVIAKSQLKRFENARKDACKGYAGPVKECGGPRTMLYCEKSKCLMGIKN